MWLSEEINAIRDRDPAARSGLEVFLTYPGLHALAFHRLSSWLRARQLMLLARIVSHLGRFLTAIEIPPGATIWTDPASGQTRRLEMLPDPQFDTLQALTQRVEELELEVRRLRHLEASPEREAALS